MANSRTRYASATLTIIAALFVARSAESVEPQDLVDATGLTFEVGGRRETVTTFEYAASYGCHDYAGDTSRMLPFRLADGHSILMAFNSDEKVGVLSITGHDEGYPGGPKPSPRNEALVNGSRYKRCK